MINYNMRQQSHAAKTPTAITCQAQTPANAVTPTPHAAPTTAHVEWCRHEIKRRSHTDHHRVDPIPLRRQTAQRSADKQGCPLTEP